MQTLPPLDQPFGTFLDAVESRLDAAINTTYPPKGYTMSPIYPVPTKLCEMCATRYHAEACPKCQKEREDLHTFQQQQRTDDVIRGMLFGFAFLLLMAVTLGLLRVLLHH